MLYSNLIIIMTTQNIITWQTAFFLKICFDLVNIKINRSKDLSYIIIYENAANHVNVLIRIICFLELYILCFFNNSDC